MPYLGSTPNASFSSRTKQDFTANGSTTAFTLSSAVASANDIEVFVGNVRQEPTDAYTVNGTTLTMSAAPANGINFYVVFKGLEENSVVPADGSISSAKIASGAVSSSKLDTNIAISGNLTTGNTSIVTGGRFISSQTSNDPWLKGVNSSNTETSYIKKDGQIYSAFGISLGGTGAANTLDDYEEGTWTPSTNIGFNSITDASYVKVGKLVFVNLSAQTNTGPGDVSQATSVSGLPFACRTGNAVSNSVIIEGLNQDVYAEIAGNSYSQIDKDNGTPITRGEFGQQRNCRVTLVYSIA